MTVSFGAQQVLLNWRLLLLTCSLMSCSPTDAFSLKSFASSLASPLRQLSPTRLFGHEQPQVAEEDYGSDYQAMCLMRRQPSWTDNPTLYFFAHHRHSASTLGCTEDIKLRLNVSQEMEQDPERADELQVERDNIRSQLIESQLFDPQLTTYIITHGFLASWDSDNWMCRVKDLILNKTKANVFIVDWSGGSQPMLPIDYSKAVANTQYVAQMIAAFVSSLLEVSPEGSPRDASHFHLIGHSLGAHISGYVGYSLASVGRITGLDPAGPCFSTSGWQAGEQVAEASSSGYLDGSGTRRLSPQSANLVVALHTDSSLFGLSENCAHYDVYVNGGVAQPNCNGLDPAKRITNLLQLRLLDTLDFNIACDHSYAHKLMQRAVSLLDGQSPARHAHSEIPRANAQRDCYPMAYECRSWEAFKAGECGYCADQDQACIFAGLRLDSVEEDVPQVPSGQTSRLSKSGGRGGRAANEEDDEGVNESRDEEDKKRDELTELFIAKASRGHHFIKSPADSPICLYHYQLVIAASHKPDAARGSLAKHYFYLELPLEGNLERADGQRARNRLVQVSHAIRPQSGAAHEALSGRLLGAIRKNFQLDEETTSKVDSSQLHFYTALITFKSVSSRESCNSTKLASDSSEGWPLCAALGSLHEARLWSSQAGRLGAVRWVAVNHMSGLTSSSRLAGSHLLAPADGGKVIERDRMRSAQKASVSELSSASRSLNPLAVVKSTLISPIDCLASSLNFNQADSSSTNIKCGRSQQELKYSLRLRPIIKRSD